MLKLTIQELTQSFQTFSALAAQKFKGVKLRWNIARTFGEFKKEIEHVREQEGDIYKSFEAIQDTGFLRLDPEKMTPERQQEFERQIKELQAIEVELWGHPLTLTQMEEAGIDLSPAEMDSLHWLIVEEAE